MCRYGKRCRDVARRKMPYEESEYADSARGDGRIQRVVMGGFSG